MSVNKRLIFGSQLTTSAATYYTAQTNTKCKITAFTLCNTTATNQSVDVFLVPSGGSAAAENQIVDAIAVNANSSIVLSEAIGHVIEPGGSIRASCDADSAVSIVASGIEY